MPVLGGREIGDECPSCGYRLDADQRGQVVARKPGSSATWRCPHCNWEMKASYFGGSADLVPRPGHPT